MNISDTEGGLDPLLYLIIDVITRLPWTRIVLIQDDLGRLHWPIRDALSLDYPLIVYDIYGRSVNGNDVTASTILEETLDPYGPAVNFLLLCDVDCVIDVFNTVNAYDTVNDEQGTFTFKARWLTAFPRLAMREVEGALGNITNVAAVVAGTQNVYTALWKPQGRRFEVVGTKTYGGHFWLYSPIFPNEAYGFNGRHFIVTTNMWGPFVEKKIINNQASYDGMCIVMLKTLSHALNFTYTLVEPPDGGWGRRDENGSWDGLIRQLDVKEADIAVAPLVSSFDREAGADFTYPFYTDHTVVVYRTPDGGAANQFSLFLAPFSWAVWAGLVGSVMFLGFALSVFWWLQPKNIQRREDRSSSPPAHRVGINVSNGFLYSEALGIQTWVAFASILSQGVIHKPNESSTRLIFGFWCVFALIVSATYSGNLVAFLTVQKSVVPFKTLGELATNPNFFLGTLGSSVWQTLLEKTPTGIYRDLWEKVLDSQRHGVDALSTQGPVHLARVRQGSYAYISDSVSVSEVVTGNCDVKLMEQKFYPVFNAVALQNNSAYRDVFSAAIARFEESGLLAYWKQMYWYRVLPCEMSSRGTHHPLSVDGVKGVFLFTGVMLLLSVGILLLEKFWAKRAPLGKKSMCL